VPNRGRIVLIVIAVVLFVLFTSLHQIAQFWTDYLWFDSVGFSQVWTRTLETKIGLGIAFTLLFFVLMWFNLYLVDRLSPRFRPMGPDEELLNRYHDIVDRRAGALRVIVSLVFAVITGAGMSSEWNEWLLFVNGGDFSSADRQFNLNVGFYVFKLPFLSAVVDWLFAALVIVLLVTAVAHYLNGGIRLQSPIERVTPAVKAHLSVLLALLALVKAADYWLQRYDILFSNRGTVNGATYTEVNAQLPALYLLLFIALASFVLFLVNIRRRGWVLPIVAVGLWFFVQVVVGEIYPAAFQRLIVQPEESSKESTAIQNNIDATKQAYGLDNIKPQVFRSSTSANDAAQAVNTNPATTRNVQLLDPKQVLPTFQKEQEKQAPLLFSGIATDRYMMKVPINTNGDTAQQETQVVLGQREMDEHNVPQPSWQAKQLNYTHGYGLALAAGNAVTTGGSPDYAVRDIPQTTSDSIALQVSSPNNYYFNSDDPNSIPDYSVVQTTSPEFQYGPAGALGVSQPAPSGGVPLDSFLRRAAFGLRFNNFDLVISQYITDQSRILYLRDIKDRAAEAAPFLTYDSDPYPAVVDNRSVYILDAYTTTNMFPDSEVYQNAALTATSLANQEFNYVRNSVKVVVDANDGSMKFYVWDPTDPIITAYQAIFPELFHNRSEMSEDLHSHLRYPEDIFTVQTDMYGRYHINDPANFYNRDGAWEPPLAPATAPNQNNAAANLGQGQIQLNANSNNGGGANPAPGPVSNSSARMTPYYVINKMQGDAAPSFMLMRAYQPYSGGDANKNQLTAFLVAKCDGDEIGQLDLFAPTDQIDGPGLVSSKILGDPNVSQQATLLGQQGSTVKFGDLILMPVDRSVLYVRSMYVIGQNGGVPLVRFVIVYFDGRVSLAPTLKEALHDALSPSSPTVDAVTLEGAPDQPGNPTAASNGSTAPSTTTGGTTPDTSAAGTGTTVPPAASTTVPPSGDVTQLVNEANQDLLDAQTALKSGDLATYQAKVNAAAAAIAQAKALQSQPTPTTSTTTSSTTPPT
jgi:uncharacterized membrane protein (UPF0182 family)